MGGAQSGALELRVEGIGHAYGHVAVLNAVTVSFTPGKVHAVLGENGAGKSTLLKIVAGLLRPRAGSVRAGEAPAAAGGPFRTAYVEQHATLFESLSVHENVWVGPMRRDRRCHDALVRVGLPGEDRPVSALSFADRQLVLLARALVADARWFLMDEPTALATPAEAERLYAVLRTLADAGNGVIVVTHHLEEVVAHADEATVLRRGVVASSWRRGEAAFAEASFVRAMFGELPAEVRVEGVAGQTVGSFEDARGVSVEVRGSEILGVGGMAGQGQEELVRALRYGSCGSFRLRSGGRVAVLAADRHREGMVASASVAENAMLGALPVSGLIACVDEPELLRLAAERLGGLDLTAASLDVAMEELSGGNQQRVVLARLFAEVAAGDPPCLVVVAEPTRGLDGAGARAVHARLAALARAGHAIVLVTSDFRELVTLASRFVVLWKHGIAGELPCGIDERVLAERMATGGEGARA